MKTNLIGLAFISIASLSLSGCVLNIGDGESGWNGQDGWETKQNVNRANLAKLALGMNQDQVNVLMGKADFYEAYIENEKEVHVLFYRTQRNSGDGKITKDECTPVVISNNSLVGWGEKAYLTI
ncbi:hypothetical protein GCM10007978_18390 [Shewanella hanedai]|uniref:DUF3192 domain-containing protein n=1 Tax=Shewanella hanedai TaxID=25 RepID=A0A553JPH4_SHEHA|nr:DUF3192 domain-containing protein [Shewanella hanedai]TRY14345.1 DUF3192 domain-containing protein [Shewanella hanedai]GGI80849.1 hypothetical protein GCM10007978_18390 [Shewanella hanedai]